MYGCHDQAKASDALLHREIVDQVLEAVHHTIELVMKILLLASLEFCSRARDRFPLAGDKTDRDYRANPGGDEKRADEVT